MCLPVMAIAAHIDRGRLVHEKEIVRSVGRMAGGAVPVRNRRMRGLRSLLSGNGVGVTAAAQGKHGFL